MRFPDFPPAPVTPVALVPAPGRRALDTLGCRSAQLVNDHALATDGIKIFRKTSRATALQQVETAASHRGMLLGVALGEGHSRRVLRGRQAASQVYARGAIYLRSFAERYRADIESPFDFVLLEFSAAALARAMDEREGARIGELPPIAAMPDPVLAHLAAALAPSLARPAEANPLFVEQVSIAMASHLVQAHAGAAAAPGPPKRYLSRGHETRAKEMLHARLDGSASIAEIADQCQLSRSHFIQAFRKTTGLTPHQWLTAQRMERARVLLADMRMPLSDVALACGFSDQSHFTRTFTRLLGVSPGAWRRGL